MDFLGVTLTCVYTDVRALSRLSFLSTLLLPSILYVNVRFWIYEKQGQAIVDGKASRRSSAALAIVVGQSVVATPLQRTPPLVVVVVTEHPTGVPYLPDTRAAAHVDQDAARIERECTGQRTVHSRGGQLPRADRHSHAQAPVRIFSSPGLPRPAASRLLATRRSASPRAASHYRSDQDNVLVRSRPRRHPYARED